MSKILMVHCSLSGNTKATAEAVAEGARSARATVLVKNGSEALPANLLNCQAVALGFYDDFSYMGGGLKDFLDRAFYPTQNQVAGKPYAAFLTHGGGGKVIQSIESVDRSFKLRKAVKAAPVKGHPDGKETADLKALGIKLAEAVATQAARADQYYHTCKRDCPQRHSVAGGHST